MNDGGAILYLEDSDDDFFLFSRALKKAGATLTIHRVHTFAEAQKFLLAEAPYEDRAGLALPQDMILDLSVPGGTGLDLVVWMRTRSQLAGIRCHVFTGSEFRDDRQRCADQGVNLLNKPHDPKEWQTCAAHLLRTMGEGTEGRGVRVES